MRSEIKKVDSVRVELFVELSQEDLDKFIGKAEAEIARDLEVDGFRKGKVPKNLIRKYVDAKAILDAGMEIALRESLAETIRERDLDVLNVSDLKVKENSPNKLLYSVMVIQFPEISIEKINFKIKKRDIVVKDSEIDETINTIRSSRAKFIAKDAPAENGDRLEIDFEVKSDGKIIEGGMSKNHPIILGKNTLIPGLEEHLVGMSVNQEKDFVITAPEDYFHKPIAGKKLDIHVKVQGVKMVELPALDGEFVKGLGKFDSIDQLTSSVKDGLMQEKKSKEKQRVRVEIIDHIISHSEIVAPAHMVDEQLESMINNFDSDLHQNGMELGPYLTHLNKTRDDLKREWRKDAEKQVKSMLVIHKVAREKNIKAEPEEIEPVAREMVEAIMLRGGASNEGVDTERIQNTVATRIINEKTLQFLEEHCS